MEKKARQRECMLGPFDWVHEISLPKRVLHHFWPGRIPLAKNTLLIMESTPKLCGLTIMWSFVLAF
jgi:hypothetical protein